MKGFEYLKLIVMDEAYNGKINFLEEELDFVLERCKLELDIVHYALGEK